MKTRAAVLYAPGEPMRVEEVELDPRRPRGPGPHGRRWCMSLGLSRDDRRVTPVSAHGAGA